jgi:protein O-mannosyl-transferase
VAAGLCLIALLIYSDSFTAGFTLDNRGLLLEDPRIRQATKENLSLIFERTYWWPYGESGLYRPVATLSYLFNYAILGDGTRPAGYHGVNFLLHFGNVLLVLALARRLIRRFWPAVLAALLWAVHPILTESVTNIVGRPDLLAGGAILGGLLAYLRSAAATGWRRWAWLAGLMGITTIGVLSKETAVVIPAVIALYELSFWKERRQWGSLVLGICASLPAILLMLSLRSAALAGLPPMVFPSWDNPLAGADFWTAKLTALGIVGKYVAILLWPAHLSCDYSYAQIPLKLTAQSWCDWSLLIGAAVGAAIAFRAHRGAFFAAGLAALAFLPTSNLLFPIGTIMAERFLYLPSVAFAICLVVGAYALAARMRATWLASVVLAFIAAALAARTYVRNRDWRDDLSLATAASAVSPHSYKSHSLLAAALFNADPSHSNIDAVIAEAEKSLAILKPLAEASTPPQPFDRAGRYHLTKGDRIQGKGAPTSESRKAHARALELLLKCRSIAEANYQDLAAKACARGRAPLERDGVRLGALERQITSLYLRLGDAPAARAGATRAVESDPLNADGYHGLAALQAAAGQADDAAVTLIEGTLLTSDVGLRQDLLRLYQSGLDQDGCAIQATGQLAGAINPACAVVRRHFCAASARVVARHTRNERPELAEPLRTAALRDFGCEVVVGSR